MFEASPELRARVESVVPDVDILVRISIQDGISIASESKSRQETINFIIEYLEHVQHLFGSHIEFKSQSIIVSDGLSDVTIVFESVE